MAGVGFIGAWRFNEQQSVELGTHRSNKVRTLPDSAKTICQSLAGISPKTPKMLGSWLCSAPQDTPLSP